MFFKSKLFWLSILSGLLLAVSWYWHLGVLIFFAWVPLLFVEEALNGSVQIPKQKLKLFYYSYCTFFIWNILVTWWIVNASFGGACMAILANSLLMTFVFLIYSAIKNRIQTPWAVWLLIPIWLAWEYGHGLWDLSWTWLNLGNVFAFHHLWIQWYEFTGASGGSLWVLAVNLLVFQVIRSSPKLKLFSLPILRIALFIIVPILFSYALYFLNQPFKQSNKGFKTMVVQPNLDPYNYKFSTEYEEQFLRTLKLIEGKISTDTRLLVLPETFITETLNESLMNHSAEIQWFRDSLMAKFPQLTIVCGANTYMFYQNEKDNTATARFDPSSGKSYDMFNTALYIQDKDLQFYHKSKLVPGVERMPFPALFKPLEKWALNLGGTIGSLGIQDKRTVLKDDKDNIIIAPVICYESVYSDYVADYVRAGANVIFIITNDGWWGNTPGHRHHLNYARLRAIENRRQIVRSANTGISCFIDELGNTYQTTNWWEEAIIEQNIYTNDKLTFFSRFGDLLSYVSVVLSLLSILVYVWFWLKARIQG